MRRTLALALALLPASSAFAAADHGPRKTPELLARGQASFLKHCAGCHGERGAGDGPAAANLDPKPRNLARDPFKNGAAPAQIFMTIGTGLHRTHMGPFAFLPDEERWAIAHFVADLRAHAGPPAAARAARKPR